MYDKIVWKVCNDLEFIVHMEKDTMKWPVLWLDK